eukprot:gene52457-71544_t
MSALPMLQPRPDGADWLKRLRQAALMDENGTALDGALKTVATRGGHRPASATIGNVMRYLITGTAGFIGFHLARRLLDAGHFVTGFDGMTPYYDVALKKKRHAILECSNGFRPVIGMLEDWAAVERAADLAEPDVIVHLAAQAGVRY